MTNVTQPVVGRDADGWQNLRLPGDFDYHDLDAVRDVAALVNGLYLPAGGE